MFAPCMGSGRYLEASYVSEFMLIFPTKGLTFVLFGQYSVGNIVTILSL
jgi:hypothetical protein